MSKFLTPPVWYDKNGNLNEMLTGNTATSSDIAIGSGAKASDGGIAIGGTVGNKAYGGIAIGGTIEDNASGGVVIGDKAKVSNNGGIAIGVGAHAIAASTIQLGHNDITYTLNVGDGKGTINGVNLSDVFMPDKKTIKSAASATKIVGRGSSITISNDVATINEPGLYLCQFIYNGSYYNGIIMVYSLDQNTYGICGYHSNTNITNSFVYFNKEQNTIEGYVQGQSTDPTRMSMTRCNRFIDYE